MRHLVSLSLLLAAPLALLSATSLAGEAASPAKASAEEVARIHDYLRSRYADEGVRHAFRTEFGEDIDCVDFFATSAAREMAARGTPITTIPSAPPLPEGTLPLPPDTSTDDLGRTRSCPAGSVPMLRLTVDGILAAGGLDRLFAKQHGKPSPFDTHSTPGAPDPAELAGYVHASMMFIGSTSIYQAQASLGLFLPWVSHASPISNHSLAQIWMYSPDQTQRIEAGWIVDEVLYKGTGQTQPVLFTYVTNDGNINGCFNASPPKGKTCPTWWPLVTNPTYGLGTALPTSYLGGTQKELTVFVQYFNSPPSNPAGWYLAVGVRTVGNTAPYLSWIGYWPAGGFTGSMQTQVGLLAAGGEVLDNSQAWALAMGSGGDPQAGLGQAAFIHQYGACAYDIGCTGSSTNFTPMFNSTPNKASRLGYALSTSPSPPVSSDSTYFYYGNDPLVFLNQRSIIGTPPISGWYGSNNAGECGLGQPVTGVSKVTDGYAHAVTCGSVPISSVGTCRALSFDPGDNRPPGARDWDYYYYKAECNSDEFVQGVSQSPSGTINGILCCKGNVRHQNCSTQVFYSRDSSAYSYPDWDRGYYKGQCARTTYGNTRTELYVAGVSAVAYKDYGLVGAPHAILCCQP
jgi:hypothetical protein